MAQEDLIESSPAQQVTARIHSLISQIRQNKLPTSSGVSLLEVKHHTLLSYISHYAYYLLHKNLSLPLKDHPIVNTLIEKRVYIEKMKPLETKIRYQIDKLVKSAAIETPSDDPLNFKPNVMALQTPHDGIEDVSEKEEEKEGTYKPPKIAPMYFKERGITSTVLSQQQKEKASRSRLLGDMRAQYSTQPEEVSTSGTGQGVKAFTNVHEEKWHDREEFEEANFVRLNMTREDKRTRRAIQRGAANKFNDEFNNLDDDFKALGGIKHAVDQDDRVRGTGVLRKRGVRASQLQDVGGMLEKESRGIKRHLGGQDKFTKDRKRMKKFTQK